MEILLEQKHEKKSEVESGISQIVKRDLSANELKNQLSQKSEADEFTVISQSGGDYTLVIKKLSAIS